MKQEKYTQGLVIITSFIFLVVCFSGCTSNQNTNENEKILSGTWVGNVQMPLFGRTGNATVTKITFSGNTVEMTLSTQQGTFSTNYTYSINGATLVLNPQFNGRGGYPGQQPYNGTRPGNWTRPPTNETWPINGTRSHNGSWPSNGTRPPGSGRSNMSLSFEYSFNEANTVLYLNGSPFTKVQ